MPIRFNDEVTQRRPAIGARLAVIDPDPLVAPDELALHRPHAAVLRTGHAVAALGGIGPHRLMIGGPSNASQPISAGWLSNTGRMARRGSRSSSPVGTGA